MHKGKKHEKIISNPVPFILFYWVIYLYNTSISQDPFKSHNPHTRGIIVCTATKP
jgi:hypothetical protein